MSTLSNSPLQNTVLRLERRKSFALGVWFSDARGQSLDITGCTVRIVAKGIPFSGSDLDQMIFNDVAVLEQPEVGYALFNLQASDMDYPAKEYPFVIVLTDAAGYSSSVVKGVLDIQDNPEANSIAETYPHADPPTTIQVRMRGQHSIAVAVGNILPPGMLYFTQAEQELLGQFNPLAQLPPGGFPNEVLARAGTDPYATKWIPLPSGSGGGLSAEGVPVGYLPTADGDDAWQWQAPPETGVTAVNGETGDVTLTIDDVLDGSARLAVTAAEKTLIEGLGTASQEDSSAFRASGNVPAAEISGTLTANQVPRFLGHSGVQYGTDDPTTGWDVLQGTPVAGDVYIQLGS